MNRNFSDYPAPLDYKPNAIEGCEYVPFGEHPYMIEILEFEARVMSNVERYLRNLSWNIRDSIRQGWSSEIHPFVRLDTEEEFDRAISTLSNLKFFFVDTKTHGEYYHIFPRVLIISFIQSRQYEYVVDLENVSPKLVMKFNKVFTDPNITKICFDGLHKIIHLQKHFSLYFVNLYDSFYSIKRAVSYHLGTPKKQNWNQPDNLSTTQMDIAREDSHAIFKIFIRSDLSEKCIENGTRTAKIWKTTRYCKKTMFTDEMTHLFYVFMWFERDTMAKMKDADPERILSIKALYYLSCHYQEFIDDSFKKSMIVDPTFRRAGPELGIKFLCIASDPLQREALLAKWNAH